MSWTAVDHEGQTMWEQGGERVKEVPDERRPEPVDRVFYCNGVEPIWVVLAWLIGFVMGMLLAMVLR